MKKRNIWERGKVWFMILGQLGKQYKWAPSLRHEETYKMILDLLPSTLISIIQSWDANNENLNTDDDTFLLTELYEVTFKELLPKHVHHRLMFVKLNGFETDYKSLDNAGLGRNKWEQDNKKLRQCWS